MCFLNEYSLGVIKGLLLWALYKYLLKALNVFF